MKEKLKSLLEDMFKDAIDDALVSIVTNGVPKDYEWRNFIDGEWVCAETYWIKKLEKILEENT